MTAASRSVVLLVLVALLMAGAVVALGQGFVRVPPMDVLATLAGGGDAQEKLIVLQLRLPRVLLAVLVGAALALSGALVQGLTGNPLADPGLLGINNGAGLGVMLLLSMPVAVRSASPVVQPLFAFAGAAAAAALVYALANRHGHIRVARLLLVGIAVGAATSSLMLLLGLRLSDQVYSYAVSWLSGTLSGKGWAALTALTPLLAVLVPAALVQARHLDVLRLGEDIASGLGQHVGLRRLLVMATSVGLASTAVAAAGAISFVGLVAPHLARRLVGPVHTRMLPATALLGALLVLVADLLGRTVLGATEIPAGVAVAILGAPYFLWLLSRRV